MESVTGGDASSGARAAARVGDRPDGGCHWCAGPAAWFWTVDSDPQVPEDGRRAEDGWRVCADCQTLLLAGDDAAVLDRHLAALSARVAYPVAVEFLREQGAARLARRVVHRASFRALDRGALR